MIQPTYEGQAWLLALRKSRRADREERGDVYPEYGARHSDPFKMVTTRAAVDAAIDGRREV